MYRQIQDHIKDKKDIIYGFICAGFFILSLNYIGILNYLPDAVILYSIKSLMPWIEIIFLNFDKFIMVLFGMENVYKAILSIAGSIVYGKRMISHKNKIKGEKYEQDTTQNYHEVIKTMGV